MEHINEMLAFAHEQGVMIERIITDGKLRRAKTIERPNSLEAWWVAFRNRIIIGNWRTGMHCTWHPKGYISTHHDKEELRLARAAFKVAMDKKRVEAEVLCQKIWHTTMPATEHSYLSRKKINSHITHVDRNNNLIVPIRSFDGQLRSLQFISPEGVKRFKSGASLKGHGAIIGNINNAHVLLVCEGYATGCSLHEATSLPVVVAFNAGNLLDVCTSLKLHHPTLKIIICADNDHHAEKRSKQNVGLDKAKAVAKSLNLNVIWPNFTSSNMGSDFNDIHCEVGLGGLRVMLSPIFSGENK